MYSVGFFFQYNNKKKCMECSSVFTLFKVCLRCLAFMLCLQCVRAVGFPARTVCVFQLTRFATVRLTVATRLMRPIARVAE